MLKSFFTPSLPVIRFRLIAISMLLFVAAVRVDASVDSAYKQRAGLPDAAGLSAIAAQIRVQGSANVLITLAGGVTPATPSIQQQVTSASVTRASLLDHLPASHVHVYAGANWPIPALAATIDAAGLSVLQASPLVTSIVPDGQVEPADSASDAQIGAPAMWSAVTPNGYTGAGQTVVVIDTGVQESHPFFTTDGTSATNRVLTTYEACYSGGGMQNASLCPNHALSASGLGTAGVCALTGCDHGTHVAGIAIGDGLYSGGIGYGGVAIGANLLPIQAFSDNHAGGTVGYYSDVISALSYVAGLVNSAPSLHIAAVTLSFTSAGTDFATGKACDHFDPPMTNIVNMLYGLGIPVVVAAGDDGLTDGIAFPSCLSSAISVGAVDNTDTYYNPGAAGGTDSGPNLTILAPGVNVASSVPGGLYASKTGTSAAAPQVAGAIALLRQENPALSIGQIVAMLTKTGRLLTNPINAALQPRLQIDAAGLVAVSRPRTIGIYRNNTFYLRFSNSFGAADQTIPFGSGADAVPIVGDWIGYSFDQIGVYNQLSGVFTLCAVYAADNRGCATAPAANRIRFVLGNPGDQPIAARWSPRGTYTISGGSVQLAAYAPDGAGVFRPTNGLLYLKNTLATGYADDTMILGNPGDVGIAGDWNLDGQGSPGVYRPTGSLFYLSNQVTNGLVYADVSFSYGDPGDLPVIGNWLDVGHPTLGVGVYRPSTGYFMLHNALTTAVADNAFFYGNRSDQPIVGDWQINPTFFRPPFSPLPPPTPRSPTAAPTPTRSPISVPGNNSIGG